MSGRRSGGDGQLGLPGMAGRSGVARTGRAKREVAAQTTAQQLGSVVKTARDIMRKTRG
jgi:hypothetical protein